MAEKDYNAIAARKIQRPAEIKRQPKFHIYARNKKGKTTFGISAGIENTLVLDPEYGTARMLKANPNVWPIDVWEDIDEAYNYLRLGDHPYTWVVVDGMSKLSNMSLKYTMKLQEQRDITRIPGQVQQRDYGRAGEVMKTMITNFVNLNLGVVFCSAERMNDGADSEEDEDIEGVEVEYVPDLPKGVRAYVNGAVDVIGRLYVAKVNNPKGEGTVAQRRLWVGESLKYDTGYRSDYTLPDTIKLPTIPKLIELMETGKVTPRQRTKASS